MNTFICDGCGQPFTDEEFGNRLTPHEPGCLNYDAYLNDGQLLVDCDCDRNYRERCEPKEEE